MIILMKCLDEEKYVPRCLKHFHDEPFVTKIIIIDGGSTDFTVQECKKFPKASVFIHKWLDWYHDNEVCQSNIALSYIPNNELAFILDFDEMMSDELKVKLGEIDKSQSIIPCDGAACFSRRTYEVIRYEDSHHAILDKTGWPLISHQIGQYPDYQMRLVRKNYQMKWINSPHHHLIGHIDEQFFDADIIHFEKDDYRDRVRIEKKWALAQARRRSLGLEADIFESSPKATIAEYYNPEAWVWEI